VTAARRDAPPLPPPRPPLPPPRPPLPPPRPPLPPPRPPHAPLPLVPELVLSAPLIALAEWARPGRLPLVATAVVWSAGMGWVQLRREARERRARALGLTAGPSSVPELVAGLALTVALRRLTRRRPGFRTVLGLTVVRNLAEHAWLRLRMHGLSREHPSTS